MYWWLLHVRCLRAFSRNVEELLSLLFILLQRMLGMPEFSTTGCISIVLVRDISELVVRSSVRSKPAAACCNLDACRHWTIMQNKQAVWTTRTAKTTRRKLSSFYCFSHLLLHCTYRGTVLTMRQNGNSEYCRKSLLPPSGKKTCFVFAESLWQTSKRHWKWIIVKNG